MEFQSGVCLFDHGEAREFSPGGRTNLNLKPAQSALRPVEISVETRRLVLRKSATATTVLKGKHN